MINNQLKALKQFVDKHSFIAQENFTKGLSLCINKEFFESLDYNVYLPTIKRNLQRDFVWTIEQKKLFILSKIIGNYVPPVTLICYSLTNSKSYEVIDGKQRLSTIEQFMNNEFSINIDNEEIFYKHCIQYFNRDSVLGTIVANVFYSYRDQTFTDQDKIDLFYSCSFLGTPQDVEHINSFITYKH